MKQLESLESLSQGNLCTQTARKHMQKTNNNKNVLLGIHIRHKKCTESLLNGDYSVKLSDRGRRKIDSKKASFFPRSPFSRPSLLVRVVPWEGCATLSRLNAFSVFCAIAAHGEKVRKQSASLALDGFVLLLRLC